MSDKVRTPYQQEMDALHVPEEKAKETLNMMLAENRRLREKEAEKSRRTVHNPKAWGGIAAAAAVLAALIMAFMPGRNGETYSFTSLDYFSLPMVNTYRGDTENDLMMENTLRASPDDLFPGWELLWESVASIPSESEKLYIAQLALRQGERMMDAEVTNQEPAIWGAIPETRKLNGREVRLGKDESIKLVFAIYRVKDLYITLSGQMSEEDMIQNLKIFFR